MSKHPSVRQTLELLERFRVAVSEITAQARQLESDFQTRRVAETRRFAALMAGERGRLDTELAQADALHQAVRDALDRWSTQRKQRLQNEKRPNTIFS